ncbi:MAG: hypothetical protein ACOVKS_10010, partial [Aquimonas sp.]
KRRVELVQGALELVEACDCAAGCPACVGPALQADEERSESRPGPKRLAQRVLWLWAGQGAHG